MITTGPMSLAAFDQEVTRRLTAIGITPDPTLVSRAYSDRLSVTEAVERCSGGSALKPRRPDGIARPVATQAQQPQRRDARAPITVPTEPLTACPVLAEQIRQCELMLSDTIPWMRANPERVEMDLFESCCGTYKCLIGWQRHRHQHKLRLGSFASVAEERLMFGLRHGSGVQWHELFGDTWAAGTLADRESRLRTHLASLKAKAAAGGVA